ncbi:MAG: tetratricopeptide repeat protein [Alphaproteobacteria bacterium]|uniref:Tetratricopeptide repeat protein n=1 Tax=Candidatus Nitrobium versatile TaxID=2884831 RepID=A0A953M3C1_9BACT|nr:tetratricopeptide repeat protein [Candidatus Nitrobium versatile]
MRGIAYPACIPSLFGILVALFLLGGCAGMSVEEQREAEYFYKMGVSYLNEGNIQMAYVQLQKALQVDPDSLEVLNSLGLVYLQLEDFDSAERLFLKAVSRDRLFSDAYNNLGATYMRKRQWSKAVESLRGALANPLYQTPEKAFYNLGTSFYRLGQYAQAADALKDSIKRSSSSPLAYYRLALVYNRMGRYGDASAVMVQAIEMDPVYRGDRKKFVDDIRQSLLTAKGDDETDARDYLEIMQY